jgi:hypothetical protein
MKYELRRWLIGPEGAFSLAVSEDEYKGLISAHTGAKQGQET